MDEKLIYLIVESQNARIERIVKRFILAFIIITTCEIIGLLWYISLPSSEDYAEIESMDGNATYVGNDLNGELNNGESYSVEEKKKPSVKEP